MIKEYRKQEGEDPTIVASVVQEPEPDPDEVDFIDSEDMEDDPIMTGRLRNSEVLANLDKQVRPSSS
jgi:hypothetical protein